LEISLPRGLRDILPEDFEAAEVVRSAFLETCRLFGYKVMEPSPLESLQILEAKSGPAIRDEIYFFKDKSERELGLRFDLTLGLTRYVTSRRDLSLPVRVGSYSSVWRYEEPQYGKYRWFYQWDIELFGPRSNAEADAEVIEFSSSLFKRIGATPKISIGSRRVIEDFIRTTLGINDEQRILDLLRGIDKLTKKSIDEIASEYSGSFSRDDFDNVLNFISAEGRSSSSRGNYRGMRNITEVMDSLKSRGVTDVEVDLRIARGLDYYTDMVFEAFDKNDSKLGSLCGGGRYDSLPAIYGREDMGATGVAGGVERALLALTAGRKERKGRIGLNVFVAPIGGDETTVRAAASIAAELRECNIPSQSEILGRSLRKILEAQSTAGTDVVVFLGEKERSSGMLKIKWMKTGEEEEVPRSELVSAIRKKI
jgi:histidyl-tRNA synthetase